MPCMFDIIRAAKLNNTVLSAGEKIKNIDFLSTKHLKQQAQSIIIKKLALCIKMHKATKMSIKTMYKIFAEYINIRINYST